MQIPPVSTPLATAWQPAVSTLSALDSSWASPLPASDAGTRFTPSAATTGWPLYGPNGTLGGGTLPTANPAPAPTPVPSGTPSGLWGGAPAWLQDLLFFAYNPIGALLAPQAPLLTSSPSNFGLNPNNGMALADIASSYNYDNLAASSATPSYLLDNGSVVTAQGVDLLA